MDIRGFFMHFHAFSMDFSCLSGESLVSRGDRGRKRKTEIGWLRSVRFIRDGKVALEDERRHR